eukprot:GHVU01181930.1.p1 GENE.GHVU01181930.1~~GHVU01181930.1.p1  ORF type:complete len:100 (+),score=0.35 GHVU01181930.1:46-300(+)
MRAHCDQWGPQTNRLKLGGWAFSETPELEVRGWAGRLNKPSLLACLSACLCVCLLTYLPACMHDEKTKTYISGCLLRYNRDTPF